MVFIKLIKCNGGRILRKILAKITEQEKCDWICLKSLKETYQTLLKLERYSLDKYEIEGKIGECEEDIQRFWEDITSRYRIPLYIDRSIKVDSDRNLIYVEVKG